jgi:hypothetical protein
LQTRRPLPEVPLAVAVAVAAVAMYTGNNGVAAAGYNLRASTATGFNTAAYFEGNAGAQGASSAGPRSYPNPITKRPSTTHSVSTATRARDLLAPDDLFFRLLALERQVDERVHRRQAEIAASTFKAGKLKRPLRIYVSSSWNEEITVMGGSALSSASASMESVGEAGNSSSASVSASWILRIEGRIDGSLGSNATAPAAASGPQSRSRSGTPVAANANAAAAASASAGPGTGLKFTHFLKSLLVELIDVGNDARVVEVIEWNRTLCQTPGELSSDGFEIKRSVSSTDCSANLLARIHMQFAFAPERFQVAPGLAALLNLAPEALVTRPQVVLALWQYIKLHKLQESDEKKIINNDAALAALFACPKMNFSDIPVLMEPFLLPPAPLVVEWPVRPAAAEELGVHPQVFEIDVDVDGATRPFPALATASSALARDLAVYDARIRELLDAIASSQQSVRLFSAFAAEPTATATHLLQRLAADYETIVGDVPVALDELQDARFYQGEAVEQAVSEFLAINPRHLQF